MSTEKELEVGQEILSYCGKCKKPTDHVIISLNKKGGADRCECKTCKAKHKYRDPEGPKKKKSTSKRSSKKAVSAEEAWNEALAGAKGPAKAYAMHAEFEQGDLIDHPTFGKGVVAEIMDGNKIKTVFESAEKVLVHNRRQPADNA